MQVSTVLSITHENKDFVMTILERLEAVNALNNGDKEDLLEQIQGFYK